MQYFVSRNRNGLSLCVFPASPGPRQFPGYAIHALDGAPDGTTLVLTAEDEFPEVRVEKVKGQWCDAGGLRLPHLPNFAWEEAPSKLPDGRRYSESRPECAEYAARVKLECGTEYLFTAERGLSRCPVARFDIVAGGVYRMRNGWYVKINGGKHHQKEAKRWCCVAVACDEHGTIKLKPREARPEYWSDEICVETGESLDLDSDFDIVELVSLPLKIGHTYATGSGSTVAVVGEYHTDPKQVLTTQGTMLRTALLRHRPENGESVVWDEWGFRWWYVGDETFCAPAGKLKKLPKAGTEK